MDFTLLRSPDDAGGGGVAAPAASAPAAAPVSTPAPASPAAPVSTPAPTSVAKPAAPKAQVFPAAKARESVRPSPEMRLTKTPVEKQTTPKPDATADPTQPKRPVGRPPKPKSIEIDGKQLSETEVRDLLAAKNAAAATPVPTPAASAAAAEPAPIAQIEAEGDAPAPTPEELQAQQVAKEEDFITRKRATARVPKLTSEDLDVLYGGGEAAVEKFNEVLTDLAAQIQLSVALDQEKIFNPIFGQFENAMSPLVHQYREIQEHQTRQVFATAYPELSRFEKDCEYVARTLLDRYPDAVANMTREEFCKEVAGQTEVILNTRAAGFGAKSWREIADRLATPAAAPAAVPALVTTPAATPAPATPGVKPPSSGFGPVAGGGAVSGATGAALERFQSSASAPLKQGGRMVVFKE